MPNVLNSKQEQIVLKISELLAELFNVQQVEPANAHTEFPHNPEEAHVQHTKDVLSRINSERLTQKLKYGLNHDDRHEPQELVRAAACIALQDFKLYDKTGSFLYPSGWKEYCYGGRIQQLIVAASLLVAEIERIERAPFSTSLPPA